MSRCIPLLLCTLAAVAVMSAPLAAEDSGMGKDLAATIALQGLPCDKVIESKRNADSDYTATCKDGNRYRVYLDPTGRVVVKKQ